MKELCDEEFMKTLLKLKYDLTPAQRQELNKLIAEEKSKILKSKKGSSSIFYRYIMGQVLAIRFVRNIKK